IFCSFFFSSRRRHTSFSRDWSSDVCSSDLTDRSHGDPLLEVEQVSRDYGQGGFWPRGRTTLRAVDKVSLTIARGECVALVGPSRSEERRVGKECRSPLSALRAA